MRFTLLLPTHEMGTFRLPPAALCCRPSRGCSAGEGRAHPATLARARARARLATAPALPALFLGVILGEVVVERWLGVPQRVEELLTLPPALAQPGACHLVAVLLAAGARQAAHPAGAIADDGRQAAECRLHFLQPLHVVRVAGTAVVRGGLETLLLGEELAECGAYRVVRRQLAIVAEHGGGGYASTCICNF